MAFRILARREPLPINAPAQYAYPPKPVAATVAFDSTSGGCYHRGYIYINEISMRRTFICIELFLCAIMTMTHVSLSIVKFSSHSFFACPYSPERGCRLLGRKTMCQQSCR